MGYPKRTWDKLYEKPPFELVAGSNEDFDNPYYVSIGFLFSTFSLNYSSSVPIQGMQEEFDLKPNHKVYIDLDIDEYLQPYYAEIKCTEVNTDENWKYYPFPALIEPDLTEEEREQQDQFPWNPGRILKLPKSRRQTKLYILIGYRGDDSNKNGNLSISLGENNSAIQILKENVILLGGIVDSAPGLIAVPYFYGGLTHIQSIFQDQQ